MSSDHERMGQLIDGERRAIRAGGVQYFGITYDLRLKLMAHLTDWDVSLGVLEGVTRRQLFRLAANLPVGCMLGYVMDGNVSTAKAKVQASITSYCDEIGLVWGPVDGSH